MTNMILRLLALLAALCLLAGCTLPAGGDADELIEIVDELIEIADAGETQDAGDTASVPAAGPEAPAETEAPADSASPIDPEGSYSSKEDVARYLHEYGQLPRNFITKNEARALGWNGGGLDPYAPGKSIGGDRFGNYEGLLPDAPGREYHECDIDTAGASGRGAKRIVYSNDGLIYYTDDHYESFTLLYPED